MTSAEIRDRVASVCAGQPFGFTRTTTPFSFELQPSGAIDQIFRIESESGSVLGGFNYSEERTDIVQVWVARKYDGEPDRAYQRLLTDVTSLRSAVIHDGAEASGQYCVVDEGSEFEILREPGKEFALLRLALPVNFELTV